MNIDKLIAIRAMGWRRRGGVYCSGDRVACWVADWIPSLDMNNAMQVVEKMRERGFGFQLTRFDLDEPWSACFYGEHHIHNGDADTPAEAICFAALKAVDLDNTDRE